MEDLLAQAILNAWLMTGLVVLNAAIVALNLAILVRNRHADQEED